MYKIAFLSSLNTAATWLNVSVLLNNTKTANQTKWRMSGYNIVGWAMLLEEWCHVFCSAINLWILLGILQESIEYPCASPECHDGEASTIKGRIVESSMHFILQKSLLNLDLSRSYGSSILQLFMYPPKLPYNFDSSVVSDTLAGLMTVSLDDVIRLSFNVYLPWHQLF